MCIEEQFYLAFPILATLMWKFGNRWTSIVILVCIVVVGIIYRGVMWIEFSKDLASGNIQTYFTEIYYPTWGRLDGLVFGVSVAAIRTFAVDAWSRMERNGNYFLFSGVIILLVGLLLQGNWLAFLPTLVGFPTVSLGFAFIVISALSPQCCWQHLKIPGANTVSTLSFSLYLLHKQIFHLIEQLLEKLTIGGTLISIGLSITASFFAAAILHFLIEIPFLLWRDRMYQKPDLA